MPGKPRIRLGDQSRKIPSMMIIILLLSTSPSFLGKTTVSAAPTQTHVESNYDGSHQVIDLSVSNKDVTDGSLLIVTAKFSNLNPSGVSYVNSLMISIQYGNVDIVSESPKVEEGKFTGGSMQQTIDLQDHVLSPEGAFVQWGFTTVKGTNGYEWPKSDDQPASDPTVYCYDSPTTFTVTFKLNKLNLIRPQEIPNVRAEYTTRHTEAVIYLNVKMKIPLPPTPPQIPGILMDAKALTEAFHSNPEVAETVIRSMAKGYLIQNAQYLESLTTWAQEANGLVSLEGLTPTEALTQLVTIDEDAYRTFQTWEYGDPISNYPHPAGNEYLLNNIVLPDIKQINQNLAQGNLVANVNLIEEVKAQCGGYLADYGTLTGWVATLASGNNVDIVWKEREMIVDMANMMKATNDLMGIIYDQNAAAIKQQGK